MTSLHVAPDHLDPGRAGFYLAEQTWACDHLTDDLDPAFDTPQAAKVFLQMTLDACQIDLAAPPLFFDVPDDSELTGYYSGSDETIHVHPRLARKSVLLHELAHHLRGPGKGHDLVFADWYQGLIAEVFGEEPASHFPAYLEEFGCYPSAPHPSYRLTAQVVPA